MLLHYFCEPREENIRSDKLRELFTSRETKILLERLDPDGVGVIGLEALN